MSEESLYKRLGGKEAVDAAVELFYEKVLTDALLADYFSDTDMNAQKMKQKAFLTYAFGGAPQYPGKSLREAHAPLVAKGLNDSHFDAVAGHLQATLNELGVPADLSGEVMSIAAGARDDVLNR